MKSTIRTCSVILFLATVGAAHWAAAQGPLTPPGAPAPTMKTLDQVEPRKPIDATSTPGDANNVFRITAPGSYYLAGPLTGVVGKHGISIEASDVTVDLRGFTVAGVVGSLDGLHVTAGNTRLTVRNGLIFDWGGDGVDEVDGGATGGSYEGIQSSRNGGDGLRLGDGCSVRGCKLGFNGVYGVSSNGRAKITGSTAISNGGGGFYFGSGSVLGSVASSNGGSGFESYGEPVLIKDCVSSGNGTNGFHLSDGAKIAGCIARLNLSMGINAGYFSTVTGCTVKNNLLGIYAGGSCRIVGNMCEGNGDGIHTYASKNLVQDNQTIGGGTGIEIEALFVDSTNNLILGNTSGGNTTNYEIAAGNRYGPIIDITAAPTAAATGDSAPDTTTTTHPWANFTY